MDGKILYLSEKNLIDNNLLTMTQVMGSIEKMFELMYQQDYVMGGMNQNSHGLRMYVEKGIQKKFIYSNAWPFRRSLQYYWYKISWTE